MKNIMLIDEQIDIIIESLLDSASELNSESMALLRASERNLHSSKKADVQFAIKQIENAQQLAEKEHEVWLTIGNIERCLKRQQ